MKANHKNTKRERESVFWKWQWNLYKTIKSCIEIIKSFCIYNLYIYIYISNKYVYSYTWWEEQNPFSPFHLFKLKHGKFLWYLSSRLGHFHHPQSQIKTWKILVVQNNFPVAFHIWPGYTGRRYRIFGFFLLLLHIIIIILWFFLQMRFFFP